MRKNEAVENWLEETKHNEKVFYKAITKQRFRKINKDRN